jgi:glycosyltransferase involved in cell wall biosynthesis
VNLVKPPDPTTHQIRVSSSTTPARPFTVFSIVARNYLAYARVLAGSLQRAHPGLRLSVLVLDDREPTIRAADEPFDVVSPADVGLTEAELHRMATIYDVMELATAMKPWVFQYHFDRGSEVVVYLDPDIEVFAPLDDIVGLAARHSIVLTPHTTKPIPRDGKLPGEREILLSGVYNLGFLACAAAAQPFIDWWSERLRRDCVNAVSDGFFVDQRWIDFVPGYFEHYLLADPSCNVAYWNIFQRELSLSNGQYQVDGRPLTFFHYSGFAPETPWLLSRHQSGAPRTLLSENEALARLCREYANQLLEAGYEGCSRISYGFDRTAAGLQLDRRMRLIYRNELRRAEEQNRQDEVPDPFTHEGAREFVSWLNAPFASGEKVSRYLKVLWDERVDLRLAFPNLSGSNGERYIDWTRRGGDAEPPIPSEMLPVTDGVSRSATTVPVADLRPGVNIYGYVFAESGVGEHTRLLVAAVKEAGIPFSVIPFTTTPSRQLRTFSEFGAAAPVYDINIVGVNADQFELFWEVFGAQAFSHRYTIGLWAWEVEEFPESMASAGRFVQEVWANSSFAARAIGARLSCPVLPFPLPVAAPAPIAVDAFEEFRPRSVFLFSFDYASVFDRKNPLGLVESFKRAFPEGEGPVLFLKSVNGDRHIAELERLRAATDRRKDIVIRDGYIGFREQQAMLASCDVFVSLHRAEGFGLTIAEAMALGKPVIATAYSGNMDFMTPFNSYLVPFEYAPVPAGCGPYPAGTRWASPDLDAAAGLMREVYDRMDEARMRGHRAKEDMATTHSPRARATFIAQRIAAIRAKTPPEPRIPASPPPPSSDGPRRALAAHLHARAADLTFSINDRVLRGPDVEMKSPYGGLARMLRRSVLRVARNFWLHQREVDRTLLALVEEIQTSAVAMNDALAEELHARISQLNDHVNHELAILAEQGNLNRAETQARTNSLRLDLSRRLETILLALRGERRL